MGIQTPSERRRFSGLRQALLGLATDVSRLIQPALVQKPVLKGSVYELKRRCGKPGCRCARGQLHPRWVLSASEQGRTRLRAIPRGSLLEVRAKVARYQRIRKARARLVWTHRRMLEILDEMEAVRREEME